MDDELAFLDASFDLSRLTKPQLRGIISVHASDHLPPASCKKDDLITVINEHIRPRAGTILSARRRVRPSDAGVVFLDTESRPSPRRSPTTTSKSRGTSRSRSSSPLKRSRSASTITSGVATGASRKSVSPSRKSVSPKRIEFVPPIKTDVITDVPSYQDSPRTATHKLSARVAELKKAGNNVDSFAKKSEDTQRRVASNWKLHVLPVVTLDTFKGLLLLVLPITLAFFLRWKMLHPFPYCDDGEPTVRLLDIIFHPSEAFDIINEYCLPCPRHGKCHNGRLICNDGFVERSNWGFGASCVPDRKQLELVDRLGRGVIGLLSRRAGDAVCSSGPSSYAVMSEQELSSILKEGPEWSEQPKFDNLFRLAIDDLLREGGDLRMQRGEQGERLFESLNPKLPLKCRLRLAFLAFLDRFKFQLAIIFISIIAASFGYFKYRSHVYKSQRVSELTHTVFQLLAEQASVHRRDPLVPATLVAEQLRDALFLKSPNDRWLWPDVCQTVAANSNVREASLLSRGEYLLSWEWIGMDIFSGPTISIPLNRPSPPRQKPQIQSTSSPPRSLYPSFQ